MKVCTSFIEDHVRLKYALSKESLWMAKDVRNYVRNYHIVTS